MSMPQDENACVNKPRENDRARFGFKKRQPTPTRERPAPEASATAPPGQETAETRAPVDLIKLLDDELGDIESVKEVLNMKKRIDRFDYKGQIEEHKRVEKPLREALRERLARESSLRQTITAASCEITNYESELKDEHLRCIAIIKAEKEMEISRAKQKEAKLIAQHNKEVAHIKSNTERVLSEAEERETQIKTAHEATLAKARTDAESRLLEERTKSSQNEKELHAKLAAEMSKAQQHETELRAAHAAALAKAREDAESQIGEERTKSSQNEKELHAKLAEEISKSQQRETELRTTHAAALAKAREVAEASLDEERTKSSQSEKELNEKLAQCAKDAKEQESKTLADHKKEVANVRSDAESERSKAQQREADLRTAHAAALAKAHEDAEARLNEERTKATQNEKELHEKLAQCAKDAKEHESKTLADHKKDLANVRSDAESEISKAQQREADMRAAHAVALAKAHEDAEARLHEERAKSSQKEKELHDKLAHCLQDAKEQESKALAEHSAKVNDITSSAQRREQELMADFAHKLKQEELRVHEKDGEMNMKLEQQNMQSQQRIDKLSFQLEAMDASAKDREEDLRSQLKQAALKSGQLRDELDTTREKLDSQERQSNNLTKIVAEKEAAISEASQREADLKASHRANLAKVAAEREAETSEAARREADLKAAHAAALAKVAAEKETEICNASQREAELRSSHTAAMAKAVAEFQRDLQASEEECNRLREAVGEEQANLQKTQALFTKTEAQLAANQLELAKSVAELAEVREKINCLSMEKREVELEYKSYKEHNSTSNQAQMEAIAELKVQVDKLSQKVDSSQSELLLKSADVAQHQHSMRRLEEQLALSEVNRRELHNTIQELKGNIRVFCRARPGCPQEPGALAQTDDSKVCLSHGGENYNFSFDKVFGPSAAQEDIFTEVSSLVQSALDGYKVCIFAYGQTGSGKTFTMQGGREPSSWGLIPRSLRQIFNTAEEMRTKGWKWCLKACFLEVYNEVLRDLLREEGATTTPQCHTIKHDPNWGMMVTNLTTVEVTSMQHIADLMTKASRLRAVGCTDSNAVSSRSHSVFALYLEGTNSGLDQQLHGALHLVDLAGSERLDKSNAAGERLKETQNINRSLSSLADVFTAKAEGRGHVPFRNSKLTHLMEPCLSGHGKTLMTVNVAPECGNSHETLCSLRFASQVSQCNTGGKAKRSLKTLTKASGATTTTTFASGASSSNLMVCTVSSSNKKRGGA